MSWLTIAFTLVVISIIYTISKWISSRQRIHSNFECSKLPNPPVDSLLAGNYTEYVASQQPHQTLAEWTALHGPRFVYFRGGHPVVVVSDCQQQLLSDLFDSKPKLITQFTNHSRPSLVGEPFASAIHLLRGDKWPEARAQLRGFLTASTNQQTLQRSIKTNINESIDRLILALERARNSNSSNSKPQSNSSSGTVPLYSMMQSLTLDILTRLSLGLDKDANDLYESEGKLKRLFTELTASTQKQSWLAQLAVCLPPLEPVLKMGQMLLNSSEKSNELSNLVMEQLNDKVIEFYQRKIKEKFAKASSSSVPVSSSNLTILDHLLDKQSETEPIDEARLLSMALALVLDGFEPISAHLSFTLHLLAEHPTVQRKLREELKKSSNNKNSKQQQLEFYTQFDHHRCEALEGVLHESRRLYPLVAWVQSDDQSITSKVISAPSNNESQTNIDGTPAATLQIPLWVMNRSEELFPKGDPNRFDPNRQETNSNNNNNSKLLETLQQTLPITGSLASSITRATVAALVSRYKFETVEGEGDAVLASATHCNPTNAAIRPARPFALVRLVPVTDL